MVISQIGISPVKYSEKQSCLGFHAYNRFTEGCTRMFQNVQRLALKARFNNKSFKYEKSSKAILVGVKLTI